MRNRYNRFFQKESHDESFWPSFTDLLTTILLVILLIFMSVMLNKHQELVYAEDQVKEKESELEDERDSNRKYIDEIEQQKEIIRQTFGVKQEIIDDLLEEFKNSELKIEIDPETGAIKFSDDTLFETNKSFIEPEFESRLQEFIPLYFDILFGQHEDEILEVVVEGHTDDVGNFNDNLKLSQERAFSVVQYILSEEFGDLPYESLVRNHITANGRSFSQPKYYPGTKEIDRKNSRRVEFKFRLKSEAEWENIMQGIVEGNSEENG